MGSVTVSEMRRMRGISQKTCAEHLGISLNSYRYKESGKYKFYIDEAQSLCELFKTEIGDIYFGSSGAKK